jgi:hypothetical protein
LVKDYLLNLASSKTTVFQTKNRDEQYTWLKSIADPKSGIEIPFLDFLYQGGYHLPDAAQNRPCQDVSVQPDFYYERGAAPGVCIFVDGASHDNPVQKERDTEVRNSLEERGYRVIAIRFDQGLEEQIRQYPDVFGNRVHSNV